MPLKKNLTSGIKNGRMIEYKRESKMNITDIRDYIKEHGSLKIAYVPDVVDEISFFHIVLEDDQEFKFYNILFQKDDKDFQDFLIHVTKKYNVHKLFVSFIKKLVLNLYQKQFKKEFKISDKQTFELIVERNDLKIELDVCDLITESLIKPSKNHYRYPTEQILEKRRLKAERKTEHPAIKTRFVKRGKNKVECWSCIYRENGKRREKIVDKRFYTFDYVIKFFNENNESDIVK